MGTCTTSLKSKQDKKNKRYNTKQCRSTRYLSYQAIKYKNLETTKKLYTFFAVSPGEIISKRKHLWNSLHYAAYFGSDRHMEFFLKLMYVTCNSDEFARVINSQNVEGCTPLMIAANHGYPKIIAQLFKVGTVDLYLKDRQGKTAKYHARQDRECMNLICERECANQNSKMFDDEFFKDLSILDTKPTQTNDLASSASPETSFLITSGKLIPCSICLNNTGLLKYTTCCGQPIHYYCVDKSILNCPYCKLNNVQLTNEIHFIKRAFQR